MPRYRNFSRLHPVNSVKHVVDKQSALVAGTEESTFLVTAKDSPVLTGTDQVQTGSTVSAIYLNVQVTPTTQAALPNVYMVLYKNPGGTISNLSPNAIGVSDEKRFVIHQEMRMLSGSGDAVPTTLYNGVIKIPRSYKRNGYNDLLVLRVLAPGVNIDYCVQCIYKEVR